MNIPNNKWTNFYTILLELVQCYYFKAEMTVSIGLL